MVYIYPHLFTGLFGKDFHLTCPENTALIHTFNVDMSGCLWYCFPRISSYWSEQATVASNLSYNVLSYNTVRQAFVEISTQTSLTEELEN